MEKIACQTIKSIDCLLACFVLSRTTHQSATCCSILDEIACLSGALTLVCNNSRMHNRPSLSRTASGGRLASKKQLSCFDGRRQRGVSPLPTHFSNLENYRAAGASPLPTNAYNRYVFLSSFARTGGSHAAASWAPLQLCGRADKSIFKRTSVCLAARLLSSCRSALASRHSSARIAR